MEIKLLVVHFCVNVNDATVMGIGFKKKTDLHSFREVNCLKMLTSHCNC